MTELSIRVSINTVRNFLLISCKIFRTVCEVVYFSLSTSCKHKCEYKFPGFPWLELTMTEIQHVSCPGALLVPQNYTLSWLHIGIIVIERGLELLVNQPYHCADTNTLIISQSTKLAFLMRFKTQ